ncbi:MAG: Gfo/Idh/MocA family oxidoreductase [Clostridiales bacterium]|nr:Gfo/Idh/MocA family oxidoreductase [Clostridiales bacterium]
MDRIISTAIIGCGGRGLNAFGRPMQTDFKDMFHVVSVCDIAPDALANAANVLGIDTENCFLSEDEFFARRRADLLVITTQDRDHVRLVLRGLSLGYDIMVEKPLTSSRAECARLLEAQRQSGRKVFVGHVLRYAPAYLKADELLSSGTIGRLISINETEQVWYGHFVHSYVRGPWRRKEDSSPVILAKCSHDLDLLQFFARSRCETVSSVGELYWFRSENAPEGSAGRCTECRLVDTCPYSAKRLYIDRMQGRPDYVFSSIIVRPHKLTTERAWEALRTGPYGRCVYRCDNDVPDSQQCLMRFENGVTAVLDMNAFTGNGGRIFTFHGSMGELIINEEEDFIRVKRFGCESHETIAISGLTDEKSGHGGGDAGIVRSLYAMLTGQQSEVTSLEDSIESHLMGIAAEESRLAGGKTMRVHGDCL